MPFLSLCGMRIFLNCQASLFFLQESVHKRAQNRPKMCLQPSWHHIKNSRMTNNNQIFDRPRLRPEEFNFKYHWIKILFEIFTSLV